MERLSRITYMTQVEIDFFWPLTEQIPLDLDFTGTVEVLAVGGGGGTGDYRIVNNRTGTIYTCSPSPITRNIHILSSSDAVGSWNISNGNIQVFQEKKPSWLHQTMANVFFGWKWLDK